MTRSLRVPGRESRVPGRALPEIAVTPVMRGYPGGLVDLVGQDDFPLGEFPVSGAFAGSELSAAEHEPAPSDAAGGTVWQQSLRAWREAGIDWQQPPRGRSLDTDLQLTEPIPAVPPAGWDSAMGRASKTTRNRTAWLAGKNAEGAARTASEAARAGRKRRATVAVAASVAVLAAAVAGVALGRSLTTNSRAGHALLAGSLPAVRADADFAAGTAGSSALVLPVLAAVAADGDTVVAVGSQASLPYVRPVILDSGDGGKTWQRAALRVHGSRVSPAGAAPVLVAGGHGRWLALGRKVAWTSSDGRSWQPEPGVAPEATGDRVVALARTGSGFLAIGENTRSAAQAAASSPVLWTSPDGLTWRRESPAQRGVTAPAGRALTLRWAASQANVTVIGGEIAHTTVKHSKGHKVTVRSLSPVLWRSTDGGQTWAPVRLPLVSGATGGLAGLAASGSGFVAVRMGHTAAGRLDALVYESAHGWGWRLAHRLTARRSALHVSAVAGSDGGVVVAGTAGTRRVAFVSADGQPWHQTGSLGKSSRCVTSVTVDAAGAVVAAGSGHARGAATPRPVLLLAWRRSWLVGQSVLAGSVMADVTVRALAAGAGTQVGAAGTQVGAAGTQVAVGSADGTPAVWWAPAGGRWSPAAVALPPAWRSGARLDSVTAGPAGWLAVGAAGGSGAAAGPVIMTSTHGKVWHPAAGAKVFAVRGSTVAQAAAGPSGYVVVGSKVPGGKVAGGKVAGGKVAGGRPVAAAWYSASLTSWHPARNAGTGNLGGLKAGGQMLAVTAAGTGFVAVGSEGKAPAVWTSPDGRLWRLAAVLHPAPGTRAALHPAPGASAALHPAPGASAALRPAPGADAVLTGVSAKDRRVVAVGTETTSAGLKPFAAVSADGGLTWRESVLPSPAGPTNVTALAAAHGGFVAVGTSGTPGNQDVIVWWSADGLSWHMETPRDDLLRGPGAQKLTALSVSGGLLTAAGYTATWGGEHPILWHARIR